MMRLLSLVVMSSAQTMGTQRVPDIPREVLVESHLSAAQHAKCFLSPLTLQYLSRKSMPMLSPQAEGSLAVSAPRSTSNAHPPSKPLARQPPAKSSKCLCSVEESCSACLSLETLAARLTTVEGSMRKENRSLKLHIVTLEERIQSLENEVKLLKSTKKRIRGSGAGGPEAKERGRANINPPSEPSHLPSQVFSKTRVFRKPSSYAEAARVECNNKGSHIADRAEQSQPSDPLRKQQRRQTRENNSSGGSFGTRFSTNEAVIKFTLSSMVPREDVNSLNVTKSIKSSNGRTNWWFTVMAPPETLSILETSWAASAQGNWKLQKSLRPSNQTGKHPTEDKDQHTNSDDPSFLEESPTQKANPEGTTGKSTPIEESLLREQEAPDMNLSSPSPQELHSHPATSSETASESPADGPPKCG